MSRINTNVPSLLAARIFSANNQTLSQSLERLSTGLRINSGKDDPAGLIASETLRSEMTAIGAAIDNAKRADNIVSVAEGALQEVSSLLVELEGLVGRTANEAGLSDEEVAANQLQVDSILDTINRIASTTEFQGKKLLNGSMDYMLSGVTPSATGSSITHAQINSARIANGGTRSVVIGITASAQTAQLVYAGSSTGAGTTTIQISGKNGIEQLSFASNTAAADVAASINQSSGLTGISASVSGTGANTRILLNSTEYGSDAFVSVEALNGTFTVTGGDSATKDYGVDVTATINGTSAEADGLKIKLHTAALDAEFSLASAFATQTTNDKTFYITGGGADFNISPIIGISSLASIGIADVSTGNLGNAVDGYLSSLGSGQTNSMNSGNFADAQKAVRAAINQVSTLRGRLGAFQKNTLASTVNSLQVALENTTAAESAIRDADFAEETSKLTRAQILVNSSTAVLQLANSAPQNALALLG